MAKERKKKKAAKGTDGLTAKQSIFVQKWLQTFNGKKAAIAAGYSEKTAEQQAARLLSNVKVRKVIDDEQARLRERMKDDANKIYAALWSELDEITEKLNLHYAAEKTIKSLLKDKNAILFERRVMDEYGLDQLNERDPEVLSAKEEVMSINFKLEQAKIDAMRPAHYFKAQDIRARLLHDLFDRAGYKATDKIQLNHSGGVDLSYMSDEELEQLARKGE